MNIKRGLIRIWVVAALIWAGWLIYSDGDQLLDNIDAIIGTRSTLITRQWVQDACISASNSSLSACYDNAIGNGRETAWFQFITLLVAIVVPPSLLLAAGYVIAWVIRGFRQPAAS